MKHTPTPWIHSSSCLVVSQDGMVIANTIDLDFPGGNICEMEANAKFIVKAVNCHDEIVKALRNIVEIGKRDLSNPKYDGYFESAKQALEKAEAL